MLDPFIVYTFGVLSGVLLIKVLNRVASLGSDYPSPDEQGWWDAMAGEDGGGKSLGLPGGAVDAIELEV